MLPNRVSNPGPLPYESGALPIALRGPACVVIKGVTAFTQIRGCVMKFCRIDKTLTHTSISDDAEFFF